MNWIVLGGSPKGDLSVTMQYVAYLAKKFPRHRFDVVQIAQPIARLESDPTAWDELVQRIAAADGVLWAFPVYFCLVHAHYKRFIELINERHVDEVFAHKPAAVLTTSIHFFDHTAHNYLRSVCDDLKMRFVGAYSADMYDLRKPEERRRLVRFGRTIFEAAGNGWSMARAYWPVGSSNWQYQPATEPAEKVALRGRRMLVLTDDDAPETNLSRMVHYLADHFTEPVEVVDLNRIAMRGSCTGCIQCGLDNDCLYGDSDDFVAFYRERVTAADIIVLAGTVRNRFLSSRWKTFLDRSFFNTHIPTLRKKMLAAVISGPVSQLADLREILQAYAQWQQAHLLDIVSDEPANAATIDAQLHTLAQRLADGTNRLYIPPPTFLAVGGMKIFRDNVWGRLRLVFQADHRHYRRSGLYDFPQKDLPTRLLNALLMPLTKIPPVRREMRRRIRQEMIRPLVPIVERAKPDRGQEEGEDARED